MNENNLIEILNCIDPSSCDYTTWTMVGMALKHEGYSAIDWDNWSSRDSSRYHPGECERKWATFEGSANPVTGGTIVELAKERGWSPVDQGLGKALEWDDYITDDHVVVDTTWIEGKEIQEPKRWNPKQELIKYLEALFEAGENVGYVVNSYENDKGKFIPGGKGNWDRTAGDLIEKLSKCKDIREVIGDYNDLAGAWIRFNPLDGTGIKNDNVTDFRYALVESDSLELDKQNALIRELELPVAALVYSGKKSVHAIVHVDASNYQEYKKRVEFLYQICAKNGLQLDTQNKNPSRLSRMPGVIRNGNKQFLIDTNIGKKDWNEWKEWIESVNDDLPDPESLAAEWDNMPKLAEPLIEGVLRQGHKMLIAGPSKAGKSFALIEMCIAIAEGKKWMGWQCTQGKVLYVNLELDRASCLHRFKDVYESSGLKASNLANIDIWNLRGKSIPMDKLAPKLIRRAHKKGYIAVVIDPIYKVITGDENSADQMANFCNQFDKVCNELNVSVIYCHHHSKGAQGGKKSMDRASGSGVFARDPDALLDLIELELKESEKNRIIDSIVCNYYRNVLDAAGFNDAYNSGQLDSVAMMRECALLNLTEAQFESVEEQVEALRAKSVSMSAWRIEGTLREFPKFEPINLWFDYPVHKIDSTGALKNIDPDMPASPFQRYEKKEKKAKPTRLDKFEKAFNEIELEGREVSAKELAEKLNVTTDIIKRWMGNGEKKDIDIQANYEKYIGGESGKEMMIRTKDN